MSDFTIVVDNLEGPEIRRLLEMHMQGMAENSPPGACHFLDLDGLTADDVTVWSIWRSDSLTGCGALKELGPTGGEVKSMRTAPDHLGIGVGRRLLDHIVATAQNRGYRTLHLETGSTPAFDAAQHLYRTAGFAPCAPFGDYTDNPFSRFYVRHL